MLSVNAVILQVSMGMALLKINVIIIDILMLWVLPNKDTYRKEKMTETPDFSDIAGMNDSVHEDDDEVHEVEDDI